MDVVEFRRLTARVVVTRNSESRAFLQAFDLAPGVVSAWPERTCASWRVWASANEALCGAVAQLEDFLAVDGPKPVERGTGLPAPA